jgi:hypothetical protein
VPSRRLTLLAAAAAAAGTVAGCGSSAPSAPSASGPIKPTPLKPPVGRHAAARKHHPGADTPGVGSTRRANAGGAQLDVTVRRVIDPLRDSGAAPLAGKHAVGVLVQVHNRGAAVYDSSATGDFSIVPSSGTAPPAFAPSGICQTHDRDFENYITAGEVRVGCVVFDVKNGASVKGVRFSPHAQAAGRLSWAVGS